MINAKLAAKIPLSAIDFDAARELGVKPGDIPVGALSGQHALLEWNRHDPWCAPLNIAGESEVFDFTKGYDPHRKLQARFGIGRFGEDRVGMYETALFKSGEAPRTVHMGLDIGAAEGTPVFAPLAGQVWGADVLPSAGDYGGTVIVKTDGDRPLYMLFGHLSTQTVRRCSTFGRIEKGELLGWLGAKTENGGWNPHLHWQISWLEPLKVDLPGAVAIHQVEIATRVFADPTPLLKASIAGWS